MTSGVSTSEYELASVYIGGAPVAAFGLRMKNQYTATARAMYMYVFFISGHLQNNESNNNDNHGAENPRARGFQL
jgi:hypothetical protein